MVSPQILDSTIALSDSESHALLRLVADSVPALLAYYALPSERCIFANQAYARFTGQSVQELLGKTVSEAIGAAAWELIRPHVERCKRGETAQYTRLHQDAHNGERMMEVNLIPHWGSGSEENLRLGAFVLINDVTHHWQARQAVRHSEERMRKFSAATEEGIFFHQDGRVIDCNDALLRLIGYTSEEVLGRRFLDFIMPESVPAVLEYTRSEREDPYEVSIRHKDGHGIQVESVGKTLPYLGFNHRVVVVRDLTARRLAQEREAYLTEHDPLTGLPNRRSFMQYLLRTLAEAQPQRQQVAVLFLDLDHFHTVNESLGHAAGDQVLCEVARRLQHGLGAQQCVGRLGGDQFALVLGGLVDRQEVVEHATLLFQRIQASYAAPGMLLSLSPSIGISLYPHNAHDADTLLHRATTAMHHAKNSGRGRHMFYSPEMEGQPAELLQREHLLREAVAQGQLVLHYQPQIDVASGQLAGLEALVRWNHPQDGLLMPDAFIALAESRGLIAGIDRWVLQEACRQLKAWHDAGLPPVPVAINLSALEFLQRDIVGEITAALKSSGLAPHFLEVEITESTLIQQAEQTLRTLQALRSMGVAVTMDDFGAGYSSLAYLQRYPLTKLKVDRSFMAQTPEHSDSVAIVTTIIGLAKGLRLRSVAEGVETPEQLAMLAQLGCELAQGYGIARPMDAERTRAWMQARATGSSMQ